MSKPKKVVKKVSVSNDSGTTGTGKGKVKPTVAKGRKKTDQAEPMVFGWDNYRIMLIGLGVIGLGMILMLGGAMPSPDVWDESLIYSARRTVIAPIVIVAGFCIEIYAIFKNYK